MRYLKKIILGFVLVVFLAMPISAGFFDLLTGLFGGEPVATIREEDIVRSPSTVSKIDDLTTCIELELYNPTDEVYSKKLEQNYELYSGKIADAWVEVLVPVEKTRTEYVKNCTEEYHEKNKSYSETCSFIPKEIKYVEDEWKKADKEFLFKSKENYKTRRCYKKHNILDSYSLHSEFDDFLGHTLEKYTDINDSGYNQTIDDGNIVFNDTFNRDDSATVDNGWTELEGGGTISISGNRLKLDDTVNDANVDAIQYDRDLSTDYNFYFRFKTDDANSGYKFQLYGHSSRTILWYASSGSLMSNDQDGSDETIWSSFDTDWHVYNVTDLDDTAETYDVYIDGDYKGTFNYDIGSGFDVDVDDHIDLGTSNADTPLTYYDYIYVKNSSTALVRKYGPYNASGEFNTINFDHNCSDSNINISFDGGSTWHGMTDSKKYADFGNYHTGFHTRVDTFACDWVWMNATNASNNAPVIESTEIEPATAYTTSILEGYCNATDADGNDTTYYWRWYMNDTLDSDGQSSAFTQGERQNLNNISSSLVNKSDQWIFSCLSSDTEDNSSWSNSSTLTISNTAPAFDQDLTAQNISHTSNLDYDINCSDADTDTITYYDNTSLFNIDSSTGEISDNPTADEAGTYEINISCGDGAVNTSQLFNYTVRDATPTAPTSVTLNHTTPNSTDTINCSASGSTDADGDSITYHYKFNHTNGTVAQDWGSTTSYDCSAEGCLAGDTVYCYAKATTASLNSSATRGDTFTVQRNAPVTASVTTNATIYANDTIYGFCNATDADDDSVFYQYRWYLNGSLDSTGTTQDMTVNHTTGQNTWGNFTITNSDTGTGTLALDDMAYNGSWYWFIDSAEGIMVLSYGNGTYLNDTDDGIFDGDVWGIAYQSEYLYLVVNENSGDDYIAKCDAWGESTGTTYDLITQNSAPRTIASNSTHLFVGDLDNTIYIYDISDGSFENLIELDQYGIDITGLGYHDAQLWVSDDRNNTLWFINATTMKYTGIYFATTSNSTNKPYAVERNSTNWMVLDGQGVARTALFIYDETFMNGYFTQGEQRNIDNLTAQPKSSDIIISCRAYDGSMYSSWSNSSTLSVSNTEPYFVADLDFMNTTLGHWFNATATFYDEDGTSDVSTTSATSSLGSCVYVTNSTSANNMTVTYNCSLSTGLNATDVYLTFTDASSASNSTTTKTHYYPNNNPNVTLINIIPSPAYTDSMLTVNANSTDLDGDTLTPIEYQYLDNDNTSVLQAWASNNTFNCNITGCDKGDNINVWIRANDSAIYDYDYDNITIRDKNISIASYSPSNGSRITTSWTNLTLNADNPDGDFITYIFFNGSDDAVLSNSTNSSINITGLNQSWHHWYGNITNRTSTKTANLSFYYNQYLPYVTFIYPVNGTSRTSKTFTLNCTTIDNNIIGDLTYRLYRIASGVTEQTSTMPANSTVDLTTDFYTSYGIDVNVTDDFGTIENTVTFTISTSTPTPPTPGGGGGALILTLPECDIVITPDALKINTDGRIYRITVQNNEDESYDPGFRFEDESGSGVLPGLDVTNPIIEILPGEDGEFGILYESYLASSIQEGDAKLVLSSTTCADIEIPISIDLQYEIGIFDLLFGEDIPISKIALTPIWSSDTMKSSVPWMTFGLLYLFMFIVILILLRERIKEAFKDGKYGIIVAWAIFSMLVSFVLMIFIATVVRVWL